MNTVTDGDGWTLHESLFESPLQQYYNETRDCYLEEINWSQLKIPDLKTDLGAASNTFCLYNLECLGVQPRSKGSALVVVKNIDVSSISCASYSLGVYRTEIT